MPPAVRPCGRTAEAGKRSRSPVEVKKTSSSSPSASSTAPTTSSPGRSATTSTASSLAGQSGATRLTVPSRVASARPVEAGSYVVSASTRSPRSSATNSVAGAPPRSDSAPVVTAGTAGRSSTPTRSTRPALVTRPTCPRAVVRTRADHDVVAVPLGRRPARLAAGLHRACGRAGPPEDSSTSTGSSATSSEAARGVTSALRSPPTRTVRRGVPCALATAASSAPMTRRSVDRVGEDAPRARRWSPAARRARRAASRPRARPAGAAACRARSRPAPRSARSARPARRGPRRCPARRG